MIEFTHNQAKPFTFFGFSRAQGCHFDLQNAPGQVPLEAVRLGNHFTTLALSIGEQGLSGCPTRLRPPGIS
jgi:hypothetical protein